MSRKRWRECEGVGKRSAAVILTSILTGGGLAERGDWDRGRGRQPCRLTGLRRSSVSLEIDPCLARN
jgi:hypothetical protein